MTGIEKNSIWVVVGTNCWGKGKLLREALENCFVNASRTYPTRMISVAQLSGHGLSLDSVSVSGVDGSLSFPKGTTINAVTVDAAELLKSYKDYKDELQTMMYGDELLDAFGDAVED